MSLVDPGLIADLGGAVAAITQAIKNHSLFKRFDGEIIAACVGVAAGIVWLALSDDAVRALDIHAISWVLLFKGGVNGVMAGIGASAVYNVQKVLPLPNILPSRSEKEVGATVGESPPATNPPLAETTQQLQAEAAASASTGATTPEKGSIG